MMAYNDNFFILGNFLYAFCDFTERDQHSSKICKVEFVWFANVEKYMFMRGSIFCVLLHRNIFRQRFTVAELFIINKFWNRWMLTTNRTIGIFLNDEFFEFHFKSIVIQ